MPVTIENVTANYPAVFRPDDLVGRKFFITDHEGDVLTHLGGFDDIVEAVERGKGLVCYGGPNVVREFFVRRDGQVGAETLDSKDGILSHVCA